MSLKVWLPLNGDLHNQGCSDTSVTNTSAVINTAGKIGSCYSFGTAKSYLKFDNMDFIHNFTECSVSLWIKILSWNTSYATYFQFGLGSTPWAHYIFGLLRNSSASTLCFTISNGSSATNTGCLTPTLELNTWYHLTLTYTAGHCKIYVNGTQTTDYSTNIIPNFSGITTGTIGIANNLTGYQTNCLINDFRIYDHCLSAAEVREISQGLVLHYKLDGGIYGNPNLVDGSNTASTSTNTWNFSMQVGDKTNTIEYEDGVPIVVITRGTTEQSGWCFLSYNNFRRNEIKTSTTYTVSFDIKSVQAGTISFTGFLQSNATNRMTNSATAIQGVVTANEWSHIVLQCTTIADFSDITVGSQIVYMSPSTSLRATGNIMKFKNIKVEEGTIETVWCPSNSEGIDRSKIEDSSGYNHNGTITGVIELSNDTPRYNNSSYFNGSSYVLTPSGSFAWNDLTQLTFSAWMKPTASMTKWRGSVGIAADSNQTARGIAITDYGNEFRGTYTNGSGYQTVATGKTLTQNEWHHCAGVLNGTEFKLYYNGILVKTETINWGTATLNAITRFEVGVDLPGTNETFTGNYSDVRCYCTALDADAIRQLYEVGAKIDKNGNWHTFEFKETNSIAKIKKTGITEANEAYDNIHFNNRAQIIKHNAVTLMLSNLDVVTTYSSTIKTGTVNSIPAVTMQTLAGKTLRLIYDVCTTGARYSAEQGQTAYNYVRYGIHGSMAYVNGSGTSGTHYPFAGNLEYSGDAKHIIQTWTVPTGYTTYNNLNFAIQDFDKPASTNNTTWFIKNVRLEVVDGTSDNITGTNLIEL